MTSNTQVLDAAGEADTAFEDPQGPGKRYSRIFGALFLAGFLVYGIGFGLAAITVQVVLLDLGVLFLLMLVPLSLFVAGTAAIEGTAVGSLLTQANTLAYELGQGTLAFGALFMTWFVFRTRMVPRPLALWGVVGYSIHLTGAVAEIFGIHVGLVLSIPPGLFEVAFGVWLIAKGFNSIVTLPGRGIADRPQPSAALAPAR